MNYQQRLSRIDLIIKILNYTLSYIMMRIFLTFILIFPLVALGQTIVKKQNTNYGKQQIEITDTIAYYPFDGNAFDVSGNFNDASIGQSVLTSDRFGLADAAYDVSNGFILSPIIQRPGTISLWFKASEGGQLITWGEDEFYFYPYGYDLSVTSTSIQLRYPVPDGENAPYGDIASITTENLLTGDWQHLVIDVDVDYGGIFFYINGDFMGEVAINPAGISWSGGASSGMRIGENFIGSVDDLAIFQGFPNQNQVKQLYHTRGWAVASNSLVLNYEIIDNSIGDGSGYFFNDFDFLLSSAPDRFGMDFNAISFDGSSSFLRTNNVPLYDNISLSTWFNTNSDFSDAYRSMVDLFGLGALSIGSNNKLEGALRFGETDFLILTSPNEVNDGAWHHAVLTYDGNTANLYLDNEVVASSTDYSGPLFLNFISSNLNLGYRSNETEGTIFYSGFLDGISYYNYGLTMEEVNALYTENNWPNTSLVASYPFNGNANDETGNLLDGDVVGSTLTQDRFGATDSAYNFNGSSYIAILDDPLFNLGQTTDLSVSGWFNTTASSGVLFDKSDGFSGYLAYFPDDGSNQIVFFAVQDGVGSSQLRSSAGFNDGNWHHFVMQMDRDGGMQIYIDGLLNAQDPNALSDGFNPDTVEDFLIGVAGGVDNSGLNTFFNGDLDDFKIFKSLLSEEEIADLYGINAWPIIGQVQLKINQVNQEESLSEYTQDSDTKWGKTYEFGEDQIQFILNGNTSRPYGDNDSDGIIDVGGNPINTPNGLSFVNLVDETREYSVNSINSVGFLGSARTGDDTGWEGEDTDMDYIGGGVYELNNVELFEGFWKIRANDDWNINWGAEFSGELIVFGPDIAIAAAGTYNIAVDVLNMTYTVTEVQEEGLLAFYPFNGNYDDSSGNGNNGTGINTTFGNDRFDGADQSSLFNGTDAYISVPDSPDLNFGTSEDIVISGWFRTNNGGVLFDKSDGSNGFFAMVQETGELYFYMVETSSSTNSADVTTGKTYNDGEWHHYVIQIVRGTSMEIWVDGEVDAINETATDFINPDMTEDLLIGVAGGVDNADLNTFFTGAQDEIRIYNQALSLDEIQALYAEGGWPIIPIPRISSINPRLAKIGDEITISGSNFSTTNAENVVSFNGVRANILSSSSTEVKVEVPIGASYGPIFLSTNGLVTQSNRDFNVVFDGNGLAFDSTTFLEKKIEADVFGNQQGAITTADFDQDGNLDLGVIATGTQFSVLRNSSAVDGEIIFDSPINYSVSSDIRIINKGDFDGDGKWDIAIAHGNIVSIFRNISSGAGNINFQNVFELNLEGDLIRELEVADLNGDGKQDIVITERFPPIDELDFNFTYTITTIGNISDANNINLSVVNRTEISDIFGFKLKDLNGDRKIDIVTSNSEVLLNTSNFQTNTYDFSSIFYFSDLGTTVEITTGDYDNDGKTDFAVTEDNGARIIGVFANATSDPQSGDVNFIDAVTFETGVAPTTIKTADFDGDGLLDIASVDIAGSVLSIFKNETSQIGDVRFQNRVDYLGTGSLYDLVIGDFNNDGKVDIISSDLTIFQNNLQSAEEISIPVSQPNNLTFSNITSNSLTLNFDAAANHNGNYLVIRNNVNNPSFTPENGVNYEITDILGEDRVAYVGSETNFIDSLLNQDTRYFYSIYAFNGSGAISKYFINSPLTGNEITLATEELASEPTQQPTNFEVTNYDEVNRSFQVNYNAPSSSVDGYLVVRTLNESPIFVPLDGQAYSLGAINNTDSIVYVGANTQFIEQNILSDNEYQYLIFSYNGSEGTTNYIQNNPLAGSFIVPSAEPLAQPTNFTVNSIGPNSVNFSFTPSANASGYLILRNVSQTPVNTPDDFVSYQFGDQINEDLVIYSGSSSSIIENNLNPSTQYFYAVYAYNGSGNLTNYLTSNPLSGSLTTSELPNLATAPQAQPTNLEIINRTENSADLTFTQSDASGYLIIRTENSNSFFTPADGITYNANSSIGNSFITYIGEDNTWNEDGLIPFTNYNFKIFAFNGAGDEINYLQSSPLQGQLLTLISEPNIQASNFTVSEQTFTSFKVSFNPDFDNANGYIVVRKLGESPPTSAPTDGVSYSLGENLSEGEVIVATGSTTEIEESNLATGATISYAIYSYNGEDSYINYNTINPLTGTANTLSDNSAPSITNIQYEEEMEVGGSVNITATVVDDESGVEEVSIQYIIPGINNFDNPTTDLMVASGNEYSYEVSDLTEAGLEFRIISKNGVQLEQISSTESVIVVYPTEGLTIPYSSFGTEESNYRIVSVPLTLNQNTIDDVFGTQLGKYGDLSKWRMFRYSNEATSELSGSTNLIPGRGYWLIVNDSEVTFSTGSGKNVSASVDQPYEIVLNPGWNQIGNPYPYDISWSDVQAFNNEDFELLIFNGSFTNGSTLSKFSGGFVNWPNSSDFTLRIPKSPPSANQNRNSTDDGQGWNINLILENGNIKNELTGIGMHENAKNEIDSKDQFNLPHFLSYIDLNHPIKANGYHVAKNIVKMQDQYNWTFDIESNLKIQDTKIKWELPSSSHFNKNTELFLWDPSSAQLIDMKKLNQYRLRNSTGEDLKIIYGSMDYINSLIKLSSFQVNDPFPNPTTGILNLNYFIPEGQVNSTMTMELYNFNGSLVNRKQIAIERSGIHSINWDVNVNTEEILKGVYLLRISNGVKSINKKIVIR